MVIKMIIKDADYIILNPNMKIILFFHDKEPEIFKSISHVEEVEYIRANIDKNRMCVSVRIVDINSDGSKIEILKNTGGIISLSVLLEEHFKEKKIHLNMLAHKMKMVGSFDGVPYKIKYITNDSFCCLIHGTEFRRTYQTEEDIIEFIINTTRISTKTDYTWLKFVKNLDELIK